MVFVLGRVVWAIEEANRPWFAGHWLVGRCRLHVRFVLLRPTVHDMLRKHARWGAGQNPEI